MAATSCARDEWEVSGMLGDKVLRVRGLGEPGTRACKDERGVRRLEHRKVRPLLTRCLCFAESGIAALGRTQGQC